MVWPDTPAYEQIDQWPDTEAKNKAYAALKALSELDSEKFGASHDEDEDVPYLRFSPEAQEIFNSWRDEFEPKYRGGTVPPALESHFMKYRSLFASLALVFEALEFVSGKSEGGSVGERSALRAAAWCEYLESHAIRLYNPLLSAPMYAAQDLLEHIDAGDVPHKSKVRDVWHKNWSGLDTPDAIREALQVLEEHGWVRVKKIKPAGGGRPAEQIYLHPDLRGTEA